MAPKGKAKEPKQYDSTRWLLKAEPEVRLEDGNDISFSIDRLEKERTTSWEGVRNHQAKGYLKDGIKLDHLTLFYHSNCKQPGVAGIAKCVKEGYPDHNAWNPKHPYFDPKSKEENPTWFMVDVEFVSKFTHFVSLKLLQTLADQATPPECVSYISQEQLDSIKSMPLLARGRLSVQPVAEEAFDAIVLLGEKGGFEEILAGTKKKSRGKRKSKAAEEGEEAERSTSKRQKQSP